MRKHIFTSQLIQRIATGVTIGGLLISTTAGQVSAGISVSINGNGSDTDNQSNINFTETTSVNQENDTHIANDIDTTANTGGNTVAKNTGSSIDVTTGSIQTESSVENVTGGNSASVEGTSVDGVSIDVAGNGADSSTTVDAAFTSDTSINQQNTGVIKNDTDIYANTGYNKAKDNTGGDVSITTGSISGSTEQSNTFGDNTASADKSPWDINLTIYGNGADADVHISLNLSNNTTIDQSNDYHIDNNTTVDTNTGGNECSGTTGGDCSITTGDITFGSTIENTGGSNDTTIDHGIGGVDLPDDTQDEEQPNGGVEPIDQQEEQQPEEEKSIIEKIIEKIVPSAQAQTTDEESVLGAMELPETGFGTPIAVRGIDILIGIYLLVLGGYLRTLAQRAQTWAEQKAGNR